MWLTKTYAVLVLAGAGLVATGAAFAASPVACLLSCSGAEPCVLKTSNGVAPVLSPTLPTPYNSCETLTVERGAVFLGYMHRHKWSQLPVPESQKNLGDFFNKFPPDQPCSLPSDPCRQARMREKSNNTKGGSGIDSQLSMPAGVNEPCTRGLPCGTVLPPAARSSFRLVDTSFNGRLRLNIARGTPAAGTAASLDAPVASGVVTLESALSPGSSYSYVLVDAGGKQVASGEFSVLNLTDLGRLKQLAAKRVERNSMSEPVAWIDALIASDLDWDANQIIAGSKP